MSADRGWEFDRDDWDGADEESCQSCLGDGYAECDEDDCFHAPPGHLIECFNCHGSGRAADQWFW